MPTTITSFNTFVAGTKARATEVNQNFSNYRGNYLPINENTNTASDAIHNIGAPDHQFLNIYLKNNPIVNGVAMAALPSGGIMPYAGLSAPAGFFICDGSLISRTTYAALFGIIGESFGEGDLSTTFAIPDLQGKFPRGRDNGAGNDPDASLRTSAMTAFTLTGAVVGGTTLVSGFASVGRMRAGMRTWGVDYPTTTIASINTAASSIMLGDTATGSTAAAALVFDFGGDFIGSEQLDAFQMFQVGATEVDITSTPSWAITAELNKLNSNVVAANYTWIQCGNSATSHQGLPRMLKGVNDGTHGEPRTSYETRPINIYTNYIIKY